MAHVMAVVCSLSSTSFTATPLPERGDRSLECSVAILERKARRATTSVCEASRVDVDAERVAIRIKMHPDALLRLIGRQHRAARLGVRTTGLQIIYEHFQMHLHDLLAGL